MISYDPMTEIVKTIIEKRPELIIVASPLNREGEREYNLDATLTNLTKLINTVHDTLEFESK